MSSINIRRNKRISPESIWDHTARKVMINLHEADDVCTAKKSTFCKLYCGKSSFKTATQKKTSNPHWNEIFYMEPAENDLMRVEIYEATKFRTSLIGEVCLGTVSCLTKEHIETRWHDVIFKKKKDSPQSIGKMRITVYYSTMLETKESDKSYENTFFYKEYLPKMKTGDIIAYNAPGIIGGTIKLVSNTDYSHVGMIVCLPNKWTEEEEHYILEVGRNNDGFLDAFYEIPRQGICIHRMKERFHHFHGSEIWWVPKTAPFSEETLDKLEDLITSVHMSEEPFDYTLGGITAQFLQSTLRFGKSKYIVCDLYGPYIIGTLMKEVGVLLKKDPKLMLPADVVNLPCFEKPILIRQHVDAEEVKSPRKRRPVYPTCKTVKKEETAASLFSLQDFSDSNLAPADFEQKRASRKNSGRRSTSVDIDVINKARAMNNPNTQEYSIYGYVPEPLFPDAGPGYLENEAPKPYRTRANTEFQRPPSFAEEKPIDIKKSAPDYPLPSTPNYIPSVPKRNSEMPPTPNYPLPSVPKRNSAMPPQHFHPSNPIDTQKPLPQLPVTSAPDMYLDNGNHNPPQHPVPNMFGNPYANEIRLESKSKFPEDDATFKLPH